MTQLPRLTSRLDRSPWSEFDADCPACGANIPVVMLERSHYGMTFVEWSARNLQAKRYSAWSWTYPGAFRQFVVLGPNMRTDASRPWIRAECQVCGALLHARNPDALDARYAYTGAATIGSVAAVISGFIWLNELVPINWF
jgi:hypothetical protein